MASSARVRRRPAGCWLRKGQRPTTLATESATCPHVRDAQGSSAIELAALVESERGWITTWA